MYCPKCGAQNQDELAYCRECGEYLQAVAQVMKKHLPVALVSKLDAVIERKNERFRRDAILSILMGTVFLISTIFLPLEEGFFALSNVLMLFLGVFSFFAGGWYFLAYSRSLELKSKRSAILSEKNSPDDISQVCHLPERTGATIDQLNQVSVIYCPRCGVRNSGQVLYCRSCGTNLDFTPPPQGVEKYLPNILVKKLDTEIAKNERTGYNPQYNSGWMILIVSFIYLSNVVFQGFTGSWGLAAFYLIAGLVLVITSGWNLAAHRRSLEENKEYLDDVSAARISKSAWKDTLPVSSPSLSEATTKSLDSTVKQNEQEEIPTARSLDNFRG